MQKRIWSSKHQAGFPLGVGACKAFILAALIILGGFIPAESQSAAPSRRIAAAIDPGHGGKDSGAVGPSGSTEKQTALVLSTLVAQELKRLNTIEPVLTRTDDYALNDFDRTGIANQANAALLISIHTGGGFGRKTGAIDIFVHEPQPSVAASTLTDPKKIDDFQCWDRLQTPWLERSRALAEIVKTELSHRDLKFPHITIHEAPLPLLEGADMPAILIEIGRLTHIIDEEHLKDDRLLFDIAQGIAAAAFTFILYENPGATP